MIWAPVQDSVRQSEHVYKNISDSEAQLSMFLLQKYLFINLSMSEKYM